MKRVLLPFSWLYQVVTRLRNHLYDIGARKSFRFEGIVTIGVGNLSMGGTGKTPVTEYLVRLLKGHHQVATLSRGYGRQTKGLRILEDSDNAVSAGDEPIQVYRKYGNQIQVAVSENRILAIPTLLNQGTQPEVIILDDAFQHRKIKTDLSILLTRFEAPFFNDLIFPAGWLRESRNGAKRADILVITKCPTNLTQQQKKDYTEKAQKYSGDIPIFFSKYRYNLPVQFGNRSSISNKIILVTGIAHSDFLLRHCREIFSVIHHFRFSDHHQYSSQDISQIVGYLNDSETCILTTEKDMVRLSAFSNDPAISQKPWFYLPVEIEFLSDGIEFDRLVRQKVESKSKERA